MTTKKRETLILNVDGCIAACFVDLLRSCGAFTQEEVGVCAVWLVRTPHTRAGLPVGKVALSLLYDTFHDGNGMPGLLVASVLGHTLHMYFLFLCCQADELIANGCLNGMFVLGRSVGFIGHYLDQKRLKQPLYRHPWDDISYQSVN